MWETPQAAKKQIKDFLLCVHIFNVALCLEMENR